MTDYVRGLQKDKFSDGETRKAGAESIVYRTGDNVVKFRDAAEMNEDVERKVALHNELFPETPYNVLGVANDNEIGEKARIVMEQPYVDAKPQSGTEARRQIVERLRDRFGANNVTTRGDIEEKRLLRNPFEIDVKTDDGVYRVKGLKDLNVGVDAKDGVAKAWDAEIKFDPKESDGRDYSNEFMARFRRSVSSAGKYVGELRALAHGMKAGDMRSMVIGADLMSPLIPRNAVIVPMPNHEGKAIRTMLLGYCISGVRDDVDVVPALLANPHEGSYHDKKIGKRPNIAMTRDWSVEIPKGRPVVVIDNVIASGATWKAAQSVLPDADLVTLADASRGARNAKDANEDVKNLADFLRRPEPPMSMDAFKEKFGSHNIDNRGGAKFRISGLSTGSAADYANRDANGNIVNPPSLQHIGTGEGSQVYGWGLYASSERGVADLYADLDQKAKIGEKYKVDVLRNGKLFKESEVRLGKLIRDAIEWGEGNYKEAFQYLNVIRKNFDDFKAKGDLPKLGVKSVEELDEAARFIEKHGNEFSANVESSHKHIYEQTFFTNRAPGDESHLLKWYEPVSGWQKDLLEKALSENGVTVRRVTSGPDYNRGTYYEKDGKLLVMMNDQKAKLTGELAYQLLAKNEVLGSPEAASRWLAEHDIDGIKYPVDSYGGKTVKDGDKAGWNYVSFRDDNIRVDHKWRDGKAMFRRAQSQAVTPEEDSAYKEYMDAVKRPDANERTTRLAPNGKRSNLTNALYHLVRTKRFKDWFGDWEKQAVAKAIIDEDEIVSSVSLLGMESKEQRAKAKELYDALKNGKPVETLDGRMVRFTGVGFKEMKSHSSDPHTLAIIPILREVISTAHYIEEGDRRIESGNELRFHVYARRVNLGDGSMIARIVLREDVNGNVFYDGESTSLENIREIQNPVFRKPIATQRMESPYASHSLAKFFDEVNREAANVSKRDSL